jgi:signal transduction histidine kinase
MLSSGFRHPPRILVWLIGAMTVVPLVTLLWLGWRIVDQDRILEQQQIRQRVERGADLLIAGLERAIAASSERLAAGVRDWPGGAVVVAADSGDVDVYPRGRVAYLPGAPALPEAAPSTFAAGEALEFRDRDLAGAARVFGELTRSGTASIRAGALLRLGRTLRKAGRVDEALTTYARLGSVDDVAIGGVPAGLAAIYARCSLLADERRSGELRTEASALLRQLHEARWRLSAPVYALYSTDAARWMGNEQPAARGEETLAQAVAVVAANTFPLERRSTARRDVVDVHGQPFAVLSQSTGTGGRALVASRSFVEREWLTGLQAIAVEQHLAFELRSASGTPLFGAIASNGQPALTRSAAETALPWTLAVAATLPAPEDRAFAMRRRWLVAGLFVLVAMALVAGYVIVRAVNRELAVAREQSDFVAAVSHEFRTPLTTLRQFTDMLREHAQLDDERRRLAYDAQSRATDRLTRLVESLLDFGRMEAGMRSYSLEPHDGGALVEKIVADFRSEPAASRHAIEFAERTSCRIDVDQEAIARALRNLLDNAVKYSPDPAPIEVGVARQNGHVRIRVRDRGIGIPSHERRAIFAKFHRGGEARTRGIKGTGIGLAMVDEIVRAHRGRVEVESEPGKGSTFTIVLPAPGTDG